MTYFPESCRGAIFDMDGTLLDSMHIWEQVDIDFLAAHGRPDSPGVMSMPACGSCRTAGRVYFAAADTHT